MLNAFLREGDLSDKQKQWTRELDSAIDNLPKYKDNKPLFRSYQFDNKQLTDFIGDILTDSGYFSTSKKVYDENDSFRLIINKSHSGADLRGYNDAESEVLFKRDTLFKIIDAYMQENKPIMEVEEYEREKE